MNRMTSQTRAQVISCLIEGCSIRSTVRVTGVCKKAVLRLLVEAGEVASAYQDTMFRNLSCRRLQVDEMWGFSYCKQKNVTPEIAAKNPGAGDVWLWVGIDADTKLVPSFMIGKRTPPMAYEFMKDLASRVKGHTQLTTDGLHWYVDAVDHAFGIDIDYAMIQKHYAGGIAGERTAHSTHRDQSVHAIVITRTTAS